MNLSALFKLSYGLYVVGVKTEKGLWAVSLIQLDRFPQGKIPWLCFPA
jgi:hypothetical protein